MTKLPDIEFIGFDLGHGETAIGRAHSRSQREPEILEYRGERSFVTAVAVTDAGVRIGTEALNLAALAKAGLENSDQVWAKFKSRDLDVEAVKTPTELFAKTLFQALAKEGKIEGPKTSRFLVGCPSGWDDQARAAYQSLFHEAGLKHCDIVSESRAALMTALEQGYVTVDAAKKTVLVVDIGSSTTDFTYCHDMDAEDVGHNILGSGLLDAEIFELNLARQPKRKRIETLIEKYPHYRPIMEYWCRQIKEDFFNGEGHTVEMIKRLPVDGGLLFEMSLNAKEAEAILTQPLAALNGFSWSKAFDYALRETVEALGGRAPETILLTGGASRLPLVLPACQAAFPGARVVRGAEPEFAIARGLAWLGRFETLHQSFQSAVQHLLSDGGPIYLKARDASVDLGARLAPALVDAMSESCILPAFQSWRRGDIEKLDGVEAELKATLQDWLIGEDTQQVLKPIITDWFTDMQRQIEKDTDPLCREHGLPAMVLSLDDSPHVSRHLEGLSVNAPQVASLESDAALMGTTLSTILAGVLLAHANLLAPLLGNPIGLIIGAALAGGAFFAGRKKLEGTFRTANVPVAVRQIMTNKRIRRAIEKQRPALISAVAEAWDAAAQTQFTQELTEMLERALSERADTRARLFLV